jgi:hypothetical protein
MTLRDAGIAARDASRLSMTSIANRDAPALARAAVRC